MTSPALVWTTRKTTAAAPAAREAAPAGPRLLQQLERHGALAGHDARVVVWGDVLRASRRLNARRARLASVHGRRAQLHATRVARDGVLLHLPRVRARCSAAQRLPLLAQLEQDALGRGGRHGERRDAGGDALRVLAARPSCRAKCIPPYQLPNRLDDACIAVAFLLTLSRSSRLAKSCGLQQGMRTCGVVVGTTIYAGMPASFAASAMDSAWLPDECVTTPRRFCSSLSDSIALYAPRNLKAPLHARREESLAKLQAVSSQQVGEKQLRWLWAAAYPFWNCSHLKTMLKPAIPSMDEQVTTCAKAAQDYRTVRPRRGSQHTRPLPQARVSSSQQATARWTHRRAVSVLRNPLGGLLHALQADSVRRLYLGRHGSTTKGWSTRLWRRSERALHRPLRGCVQQDQSGAQLKLLSRNSSVRCSLI